MVVPEDTPIEVGAATHFAITFQGGFAGTSMMLSVGMPRGSGEGRVGEADAGLEVRVGEEQSGLVRAGRVWAEDNSRRQVFE